MTTSPMKQLIYILLLLSVSITASSQSIIGRFGGCTVSGDPNAVTDLQNPDVLENCLRVYSTTLQKYYKYSPAGIAGATQWIEDETYFELIPGETQQIRPQNFRKLGIGLTTGTNVDADVELEVRGGVQFQGLVRVQNQSGTLRNYELLPTATELTLDIPSTTTFNMDGSIKFLRGAGGTFELTNAVGVGQQSAYFTPTFSSLDMQTTVGGQINMKADTFRVESVFLDALGNKGSPLHQLSFNAAGQLIIEDKSDAGSVWDNNDGTPATEASTDIRYMNGNVGIGKSATEALSVLGQIDVEQGTRNTIVGANITGDPTGNYNTTLGNGINANYSGNYNVSIGSSTGGASGGGSNIFIGRQAGQLADASSNIGLGYLVLRSATGFNNIAIGTFASQFNTTGASNVSLGERALRANEDGDFNVAIGRFSGTNLTNGSGNTAIGTQTLGSGNTLADFNNCTAIGLRAMEDALTSINTTAIGAFSGLGSDSDNSVFIGNRAGSYEDENNRLHIANSVSTSTQSDTPLIYGEFDNDYVRIRHFFGLNPRTTTERDAFSGTLEAGIMTYNSTVGSYQFYDGTDWRGMGDNSLSEANQTISAIRTIQNTATGGISILNDDGLLGMKMLTNGASNPFIEIGNNISHLRVYEDDVVRLRLPNRATGKVPRAVNGFGDIEYKQANNAGRTTESVNNWGDDFQTLYLSATSTVTSINFPNSAFDQTLLTDGDRMVLINRTGNTVTLTGEIEQATSATFDVLDGETAELQYIETLGFWVSVR